MTAQPPGWTPARLRGSVTATATETGFAGAWGVAGASLLRGPSGSVVVIVVAATTLVLLAVAVRTLGAVPARGSGDPERATDFARARTLRWVVLVEVVAVALMICVLAVAGLQRYLAPAVALVVGIHFLPLGRIFRTSAHYFTAILLTGAGLIALIGLVRGGSVHSAEAWDAALDFTCAVVLWSSAISIFVPVRRVLRSAGEPLPARSEGS